MYIRGCKGNSSSHGARPVHPIITMIKWIRTSRLSIKNSLSSGLYGFTPGTGRQPELPEGVTKPAKVTTPTCKDPGLKPGAHLYPGLKLEASRVIRTSFESTSRSYPVRQIASCQRRAC